MRRECDQRGLPRLIDTTQAYQNEEGVGAAIKTALAGGLKREELFIITKLWTSDAGEERAKSLRCVNEKART